MPTAREPHAPEPPTPIPSPPTSCPGPDPPPPRRRAISLAPPPPCNLPGSPAAARPPRNPHHRASYCRIPPRRTPARGSALQPLPPRTPPRSLAACPRSSPIAAESIHCSAHRPARPLEPLACRQLVAQRRPTHPSTIVGDQGDRPAPLGAAATSCRSLTRPLKHLAHRLFCLGCCFPRFLSLARRPTLFVAPRSCLPGGSSRSSRDRSRSPAARMDEDRDVGSRDRKRD
ncbi:formin-like protein 5 [Triticum dicoccoides]|uniref:formin-like protein 5 n=1 Tax=Triticum dicoccoides TaxID=85692 RepID=UPI00188E6A9A|nr:formin-like protein 5 [Triticum dicoccoides]